MRRALTIAGLTAGTLLSSGVAARAATLPITLRFDQGTVAVGTFPTADAATAAVPAMLQGTIDSTTFAAAFPAATISLPDAVVESVDYGTTYGAGRFVVDAVPGAFTGTVNPRSGSLDLRGLIAYRLTATTAMGTFTCISDTPVPLQLAGTAIDPVTGAYGVSGEQTSLTIRPEDPANALETTFCARQAQKVSPGAPVRSEFSGTLAIPGVIPTPTGTTPLPAPLTPTVPSPSTGASRLVLEVSRPKSVRRGRSTSLKVVVRNSGAASARAVSLRVHTDRGVTPRSRTTTFASIPAGRSRTLIVRLRTTARSGKRSVVRVTARGVTGPSVAKATTLRLR